MVDGGAPDRSHVVFVDQRAGSSGPRPTIERIERRPAAGRAIGSVLYTFCSQP